jgi:hypothetical protein
MRTLNTQIDGQTVPTLEDLGGPSLDFGKILPANFVWSGASRALDQGQCGACWAFASVAALGDRYAIWSDLRVELSPYKMLVCNLGGLEHDLNFGDVGEQVDAERRALAEFECRGNSLEDAWRYLFTNGVPQLSCVPASALGSTCTEVVGWREDTCPTGVIMRTFRCRAYYSVPPDQVAREIYERGPVSAAFAVRRDFWGFDFKREVYEPKNVAGPAMGHAVRIIGWGESPKEGQWWWVVNSFGTGWGMDGLFRMRRGFLETHVMAGLPDAFGEGPLYATRTDLRFRERVERLYGLDPNTGKFRDSETRSLRPRFYHAASGASRAQAPTFKEVAAIKNPDLNIDTNLFEDTHAGFRIGMLVLATLCVVVLWVSIRN